MNLFNNPWMPEQRPVYTNSRNRLTSISILNNKRISGLSHVTRMARTGETVHPQLRLNAQSNEEQASDNMQSIIFHLQNEGKQARLNITKCKPPQPHFLKTNVFHPDESKIEMMSAPLQNQMTVLRQFR
jgi:hypothetical protein